MVLPEESDPRLQGSWVPGTPAKPVLKRLAAAASGQESNSTVLSWFRSATASSDGHAGLRGFEERAVGLSGGEAAVVAMESCSPSCSNNVAMRAQPMGETIQEWSQVRYTDRVVPTNPATASSSVVASLPMFFHGSPMHGEGTSSSQLPLNGTVMLSSDVLRDTETGPVASGAVVPPFAPVTPEKQKVAQDVGHPGSACSDDESKTVREGLCMASILPTFVPKGKGPIQLCFDNGASERADFVAAAEGLPSQLQESEIRVDLVPKEKGPVQLCFDKGASEEADFVAQGLPSQLQENKIIEEAEKQGIDLNKTPQQKPRRKKHRPKVVQEGKPSRTPKSSTPKPATPNPATNGKNMSTKRKYVRRKGINSPLEAPSSEVAEQNVELDKRKKRGPAKRRLDFSTGDDKAAETLQRNTNSGSPEQVESLQGSSSNYATGNDKNDGKSTGMFIEGQKVPVNSSAGIAPLLNPSNSQILETSLNSLDIPSLHLQPSRRELIRENLKKLARLRDSQDVQSHSGINHSEMQTDRRLTPEGSVSTSASNLLSTDETMMSARKMDNNLLVDGMQLYNENIVQVDFIHEKACNYDEMYGSLRGRINSLAYLPERQKKRRTGKGHNELAFNEVASFANAQRLLDLERVLDMEEGKQTFGHRQIKLMKSLEAPIRACNLASLRDNMKLPTALHNPNMHDQRLENGIIRGPQGCVEALAADTHAKVRTKRNRKKEQTQVASVKPSHTNQLGLQEQDSTICSLRQKSGESISSSASNSEPKDLLPVQVSSVRFCNNVTSSHAMCRACCFSDAMLPHSHGNETLHSLDIIVQKMKYLNINEDQGNKVIQEQTALVPFGAHGMIVPFEGQFYPIKKLRHRAKIVLDEETNRVWNLLMGKESNNGVEGTAADKEKWWKEERGVFHGRADSFIARMHLVQGDRRFSPWKGSVLDSVIGVFLTQNVADHLSSSAFMSLAARFPPRSREKSGEASTSTEQDASFTAVHVAGKCSDKSVSDQNSGVDNGAEQMGEKAIHPSGNNVGGDMFSYSKDKDSVDNPLIVAGDRNMIKANEMEPFECVHSSQNSVVSSQNSSGDPFLTIDQIGSSSEANSEAEYLITGKQCSLESKTSCMELLEMAENGSFHDLHKLGNRESSKTENFKSCETENFDSPSTDNQEYRLPSGKERLYFPSSIASRINPISEIKVSGTEGFHSANATVSNHQNSTLASQSSPSGDLQAFTGDLAAQSLHASSIKADYGKHSCYFDGISSITTVGPTNNSFHNYSGLQEGMSTEVPPKQRRAESHSINVQIASEALSQTQNFRGHQFYSGSPPKQRPDVVECFTMVDKSKGVVNEGAELASTDETCSSNKDTVGSASNAPRGKRGKLEKEKKFIDWDDLRRQVCENGARKERSSDTMDSLDWEAVRDADVNEISSTIRERGMNNKLAERIKGLLDRLMKEHGSIDLEWLRDVPPDKTKDFLLSIKGLGLKSVECVRLLTLHHLAFPVDTNVGRICVRLGWVPLQPLPESLQLHLLELYPMLETIQKYLWPRLCTLDQRTLYELHYQMITFGKVFCTKSKPNCNACPMRGECRHFASAFASARLPLPGPEDKSIVTSSIGHNYKGFTHTKALPQLEGNTLLQEVHVVNNREPIIEEPATPEPECTQIPDIEDAFYEDTDEIPAIKLNIEEFAQNLQNYMQQNDMVLQDVDLSKALIAITPEAASIPVPKLKNVSRLRTEHQVYELPDSHPLLEGLDQREAHDPCPYLLAIWTPGETAQSTEPPESCCKAQGTGNLCGERTCFSCNSIREAQTQMVRGTLLIPCRTAMRGSFPLNGTYFQVNEVFADHESSLKPIDVPRGWIWNLPRRTVYFGTSIPTIFKGLAIADIQNCFWRGFVCVRGFDRTTRGPRRLMARLHFPASMATRNKRSAAKDDG